MPSSMASSSPWMASSCRWPSSSSSPCGRHRPAAARCPRHAAWPGRSLWNAGAALACSCSVRVCTDLRCSSSASMRATSSLEATGGCGQPLLRLGAYQFGIEHALFLVSCRLSAVRGPLALRRPRRRHRRRRGSLASSAEPIPLRIFCVGGDWCDPARPGVPACRGSSVPGPSAPA